MKWRSGLLKFCDLAGLPVLEPFVRLGYGEDPKEQLKGIAKFLLVPVLAVGMAISVWSAASRVIHTDSLQLPSPSSTWAAGRELIAMHFASKAADSARQTEKLQEAILCMAKAKKAEQQALTAGNAEKTKLLAMSVSFQKQAVSAANYEASSAPTFVEQIFTSLKTGSVLAASIAR